MQSFDAVIIGTGQAGPPLARRLAAAGQRVAIIERGRFGGTCVNTGCTPTKAMVASAYAAHMARRAGEFGVSIDGPISIDWAQVRARKDAISGASRTAVERSLRTAENVTVLQGDARLSSSRGVTVDGQVLSAGKIFLNVGGRPGIPPIPGIDTVAHLTSDTIMDFEALPAHLVVLGGSYVGLEFAQMFRRFGAAVSVIETAPRLIAREDDEISDWVKRILEAEGIRVVLNATELSVTRHDDGPVLRFSGGEAAGSHLLVATGRRPNT
ncbi:MAG TPA: FAD-dependent oxidoreductase, partial [Acetobacteraceae bacterium]|nr:FAD-dependent oxidoreductase [Acetobacteraceae bacterium]